MRLTALLAICLSFPAAAQIVPAAPDSSATSDPQTVFWKASGSPRRLTAAVRAGSTGLEATFLTGASTAREPMPAVLAWLERQRYDLGDTATISVRNVGEVPGYVAVMRFDPDGTGYLLFPAAPADDNYVSQGQTMALHRRVGNGTFVVNSSLGTGMIVAMISRDPIDFSDYARRGAWKEGALHLTVSPADASTENWGRLYRETNEIAQRMSDHEFSVHLIAYDIAPRGAARSAFERGVTPGVPTPTVISTAANLSSSVDPDPAVTAVNVYWIGGALGCARTPQGWSLSISCAWLEFEQQYGADRAAWCAENPQAGACGGGSSASATNTRRDASTQAPRWITAALAKVATAPQGQRPGTTADLDEPLVPRTAIPSAKGPGRTAPASDPERASPPAVSPPATKGAAQPTPKTAPATGAGRPPA